MLSIVRRAARTVLARTGLAKHVWPHRFRGAWPLPIDEPTERRGEGDWAARVAVLALGPRGLEASGKIEGPAFLGAFGYACAERGIAIELVTKSAVIRRLGESGFDAVLNILQEEEDPLDLFERAEVGFAGPVYNRSALARIIADKRATHQHLLAAGLPVPRLVEPGETGTGQVFSNARFGSHLPTALLKGAEHVSPDRHNTEFVDTRVAFEGKHYYTTVRIAALNGTLLAAWVRARDEAEGSANVHSRDTPLHPALLRYLHAALVTDRMTDLLDLTLGLGNAYGNGVFVHDLLTCAKTGRISVAESGLKFDDETYRLHLLPIVGQIRDLSPIHEPDWPARVAGAFADSLTAALGAPDEPV